MTDTSDTDGDSLNYRRPPQIVKSEEGTNNITLLDVYQVGLDFEYLRTLVDTDDQNAPTKSEVLNVLDGVQSTLDNQDTRGIVTELVSKQQRKIGEPSSPEEQLNQDQAEELKKQVTSWIHLFSRDLANETRIPASPSGVLDIDILTENPGELFNQEVWGWLDQRPREDIKEACRSAAVGCATASVMLSLRAVEHCLREWYEQENKSLDAAWGRVLDQLMEEYAEDDKRNDTVLTQLSDLPPVLTTLYYLKEKRNEVNHPDESPTPREARRTLLIVSSTITEIYEVMKDKAVDEAQATFDKQLEVDPSSKPNSSANLSRKEREIMNVILQMDDGNGAERELVIDAALDMGYMESDTAELIQQLLMGGYLYEPADGMLKPI